MIHTFGDSHSEKGWKEIISNKIKRHYISGLLCYSFGRENLNRINISEKVYGVEENDIVCFCLGEIDCRCHIHKHITVELSYQMIINNIVENYFNAIKKNIANFKKLTVCVMSITPAVDSNIVTNNSIFPFRGTNEDRIKYTEYFNSQLYIKCKEYNYLFIDVYEKYIDNNRLLNIQYKDKNVHIKNPIFLIEKLKELGIDI